MVVKYLKCSSNKGNGEESDTALQGKLSPKERNSPWTPESYFLVVPLLLVKGQRLYGRIKIIHKGQKLSQQAWRAKSLKHDGNAGKSGAMGNTTRDWRNKHEHPNRTAGRL